jgi:hypothetical protein
MSKNVQHCAGPCILIMAETYRLRLCHRRLRHRPRPTTAAGDDSMMSDIASADANADAEGPGVEEMPMAEPQPPSPLCRPGGVWGRRGREPGPCRACPSQGWPSRAESRSRDSRIGDSAETSDSRLGASATRAVSWPLSGPRVPGTCCFADAV